MKHLAPRHCCSRRKKATFTLCEQNWRIETWFWTTPRQSHTVRDHVDKLNYVFSLDTFELTDHGLGERLSLVPCTHKKNITPMKCLDGEQGFSFSLGSAVVWWGVWYRCQVHDEDHRLSPFATPICMIKCLDFYRLLWLRALDVIHHRHRG